MATAQRIATDRKWVPEVRHEKHQKLHLTLVDGVEYDRVFGPVQNVSIDTSHYEDQPDGIQLTLTLDEAETLRLMLWKVGGDPGGRRGDADEMNFALSLCRIPQPPLNHPDLGPVGAPLHFPPLRTPLRADVLKAQDTLKQAVAASGVGSTLYGAWGAGAVPSNEARGVGTGFVL